MSPRVRVERGLAREAGAPLHPPPESSLVLRILPVFVLALASCASIVSKSDWLVTLDSEPSGATITIRDEDGKIVDSGMTPMAAKLSSKDGFFTKADYDVEAHLAGYAESHTKLSAQLNPWYFGNIIFGGLIGLFIVDPATGAMWKLKDPKVIQLSTAATQ